MLALALTTWLIGAILLGLGWLIGRLLLYWREQPGRFYTTDVLKKTPGGKNG